MVEDFHDIRRQGKKVELLVKWSGFEETDDDRADLESLQTDVPKLLQEFLDKTRKTDTRRQHSIVNAIFKQ